jgi:hypothetical protein
MRLVAMLPRLYRHCALIHHGATTMSRIFGHLARFFGYRSECHSNSAAPRCSMPTGQTGRPAPEADVKRVSDLALNKLIEKSKKQYSKAIQELVHR